jgi:hypothetical protein
MVHVHVSRFHSHVTRVLLELMTSYRRLVRSIYRYVSTYGKTALIAYRAMYAKRDNHLMTMTIIIYFNLIYKLQATRPWKMIRDTRYESGPRVTFCKASLHCGTACATNNHCHHFQYVSEEKKIQYEVRRQFMAASLQMGSDDEHSQNSDMSLEQKEVICSPVTRSSKHKKRRVRIRRIEIENWLAKSICYETRETKRKEGICSCWSSKRDGRV